MELQLGTARQRQVDLARVDPTGARSTTPLVRTGTTCDWRALVPALETAGVTLRELCATDAPSLLEMLAIDEVARFITPPPTTVAGFERFITWAQNMRRDGSYLCFALVPRGFDRPVGILQLRALTPDFAIAEWGFAIGVPFWGTGLFMESAEAAVDFAIDLMGVQRLEARAVTLNGRGNGALTKLGAVREAVLRQSFSKAGQAYDQYLWGILAADWRARRPAVDWGRDRLVHSAA
jgi:RimJ/RimL family protein N-acetyltransferase